MGRLGLINIDAHLSYETAKILKMFTADPSNIGIMEAITGYALPEPFEKGVFRQKVRPELEEYADLMEEYFDLK